MIRPIRVDHTIFFTWLFKLTHSMTENQLLATYRRHPREALHAQTQKLRQGSERAHRQDDQGIQHCWYATSCHARRGVRRHHHRTRHPLQLQPRE